MRGALAHGARRQAGCLRQAGVRLFVKEFVVELPGGVDTRTALAGSLLALMAEISRESRN